MNFKAISNAVTSTMGKQLLVAQKNSPTMLFVGGVAGVIGTVVLASRASLKLEEKLEETSADLHAAKNALENERTLGGVPYSPEDYKKDVALIRVKGAINIAKLYAPAIFLGVASIGALAGSHNILNKRNVALTAAVKLVENRFADYRQRIEAEFGKEKVEAALQTQTIEVDDPNKEGKKKKVKLNTPVGRSPYSYLFDELTSSSFSVDPSYNRTFLERNETWATERLRYKGHLFLNEVLDQLGMDRVPEGQIVGWVYDPRNTTFVGDGYVDFGMHDGTDIKIDFLNGRNPGIMLDFNVDGPIYEALDRLQQR
jgi:hypothetical protein